MKCPKCGYLGFEQVERCRNCGYEFSLARHAPTPDLRFRQRRRDEINPLEDLSFLKEAEAAPASEEIPEDLPLFGQPQADDRPLITKPRPPRAPLSVRRATPEVPRLRSEPRPQNFDLTFDADAAAAGGAAQRAHDAPRLEDASHPPRSHVELESQAGLGARFVAAAIDVVLLAAVDVLVVYFTMQISGVSLFEVGVIPKAPLLVYLLVQNGGYFVAFTAGGQTLGKMAMGIKVITDDEHDALDLGRAFVRTLMWGVLAAPVGLGFLTALTRDGRGLHDRVADVVKPYPADRLERLPGGVGVMADDAMAAIYANLALRLLIWLSGHLVIWSLMFPLTSPVTK